RRPGAADGVRGDLLGGRATADLHSDLDRGERSELHARARERTACEHVRSHLPRRDRDRLRDGGAADDPHQCGPELSGTIDLGLRVVDLQLLDAEGRRCWNVDELSLEGGPGERLEVVAIYSGPGAFRHRAGFVGRLAAWLFGGEIVRIPWVEVAGVAARVSLRRRA